MDTVIHLQKIMSKKEEKGVIHHPSLFLTNNSNKTQLINLLANVLKEAGHIMKTIHHDADTLIVFAVLDFATERMSVRVTATDTNVLIMLLHFWNDEMANILMLSDSA